MIHCAPLSPTHVWKELKSSNKNSEQNKSFPLEVKKNKINPTPCTLQTSVGETFLSKFDSIVSPKCRHPLTSFWCGVLHSLAYRQRHTRYTSSLSFRYSESNAIFSSMSFARPQWFSDWLEIWFSLQDDGMSLFVYVIFFNV